VQLFPSNPPQPSRDGRLNALYQAKNEQETIARFRKRKRRRQKSAPPAMQFCKPTCKTVSLCSGSRRRSATSYAPPKWLNGSLCKYA